jgi:hypothetical protein
MSIPFMGISDHAFTAVGNLASEDTIVEEHTAEGGDNPEGLVSILEHSLVYGSATGSS